MVMTVKLENNKYVLYDDKLKFDEFDNEKEANIMKNAFEEYDQLEQELNDMVLEHMNNLSDDIQEAIKKLCGGKLEIEI